MTVKLRNADNKILHEADVATLGEALEDAVKKGVSLKGVNLEGAKLRDVNLKGADLEGANFEKAKLQNVSLEGANLKKIECLRTDFQSVNAKNSDFSGVDIYASKIQMSDFQGANFQKANLSSAKIENSNFEKVNFEKTRFSYTSMGMGMGSSSISRAKFNEVKLDDDMPRVLKASGANVKNPIVNGVKQPTGIVASLKKKLGRDNSNDAEKTESSFTAIKPTDAELVKDAQNKIKAAMMSKKQR